MKSFLKALGPLLLTLFIASCSTHEKPDPLAFSKFENAYRATEIKKTDPPSFGGLKGFLVKGHAEQHTGIYLTEPFDPQKIPVLFIHGLLSEPKTWERMAFELKKDPEIRDNFQFLFYAYPSGTPIVPSAAILKNHLDRTVATIERDFKISMNRRLIVAGHSMGGILAKSLVSDTGDRLWDTAFNAPVEEFDLSPQQKTMLSNAFRYEPRSYVNSVIFLASPQRGSNLASSFVGRIGAKLSARPQAVEDLASALLTKNKKRLQPEFASFIANKVNSITTLKPDSPVTSLLADLPIDEDVTYHTVAGVPSFDYQTEKAQNKGDGVVPLWSAELKGARCEIGLVSGHSIHFKETTIKVVQQILKVHGGQLSEAQLAKQIQALPVPFARYNYDGYPLNVLP